MATEASRGWILSTGSVSCLPRAKMYKILILIADLWIFVKCSWWLTVMELFYPRDVHR